MPLNINDLENRIQQKIDGLSTANSSIEFVIPSMTEVSNVKSSVANTASLPNIYADGIPNGTVVFVESLGVPVIASKCSWLGLDGRLLQKDVEFGLWSWGRGLNGVLGDATIADRSSPVSVVGGFTDWCSVSLGSSNSAGLRSNGTLWTWGFNIRGQLGDGTTVCKSSPVSVVGGFTDWCDVSAGGGFVLALRTNGTLWSWGDSSSGQGGGSGCFCSPRLVPGSFTDWCQISASSGGGHSVALRTNGTLWSFGCNGTGRLGDGTTTDRFSPVSVIGNFTDWCRVSAGGQHTVALRTNGTIWTWGAGSVGRLGTGNTTNVCSPVSVLGGFTDWCQIAAGYSHSVAMRTNGTLWSWGGGTGGGLGDGTASNRSSPVSVVGGFTDWCQISGGRCFSVALRTNGTLWSWGSNYCGSLGDGTTDAKCSPVSVISGFTDWCRVEAGSCHTAAIRACIL